MRHTALSPTMAGRKPQPALALALALVLAFTLASAGQAAAQIWTWRGGSDTCSDRGSEAQPSARCCAHTWLAGANSTAAGDTAATHLYLFGGFGEDQRGINGYLNDLWRMDLASLQWTYLGGDRIANRASNGTYPGSRHYAVYWQDNASGMLWLWGGFGSAHDGDYSGTYLADMWSLDLASGAWTARHPQGTGPLPRIWSNFWQDGQGNVYVSSGIGGNTPQEDVILNDLWLFSSAAESWGVIYNYSSPAGVYTHNGPANPGFREGSYTATDEQGRLWLYGGFGFGNSTSNLGNLQDVWSFDPVSRAWTWVSGDGSQDGLPVYGPKGCTVCALCSARRARGLHLPVSDIWQHVFSRRRERTGAARHAQRPLGV